MQGALVEIGQQAKMRDIRIELAVCHGRCYIGVFMVTGRPAPFAITNGRARAAVAEVEVELRLRTVWLDTEAVSYLTGQGRSGALAAEARETGLMLSVNQSARVLAHKLSVLDEARAPADGDAEDVRRLLSGLRGVGPEQVEAIFARYCPLCELGLSR